MAERIGQQLGNYRLIRLLGEGGFAEVYLGEHIHLGTQAAIKVLHTQLTSDDVDHFRAEARTIARLVHPNIVRVLEFGVEGKTPFLVMDYAPNGTLRQRHPKGTLVPLATVVSYIKDITNALQCAHDEKLIHRDIKPENILLGKRGEVLLGDFGIALVAQSSHYQNIQDIAGTITYMAPEQIQGKPRLASDQYALAVVVYEWLSGDRPFHGSFAEIAVQHAVAVPRPLRERIPISPEVEQVVMIGMAKEPGERFSSIQAFGRALEQAFQEEKRRGASEEQAHQSQIEKERAHQMKEERTHLVVEERHRRVEEVAQSWTNEAQVASTLGLLSTPKAASSSLSPKALHIPLSTQKPVIQQTPSAQKSLRPGEKPQRTYSRRTFVLGGAGVLVLGAGLIWFGSTHSSTSGTAPGLGGTTAPGSRGAAEINLAGPIDIQTLITEAKKEGKLEAIGIPPEWADYKEILASYTEKYVPVEYQTEAEYSSAQELEVFIQSKQHPHGDIADISFKFGSTALQQGLITPYKHSQWADIPENLKDPNGNWCTEYWGTQAFVVNTDLVKNVPTSFKELLSGDYKNMVGIDGDPRQAYDAFIAIYSAALAQSGSLDDIQPGVDFFAQLKKKGNFTAARASQANIATGEVAIGVIWDYLGLGFRDALNGKPNLQVVIPSDGSIAGPYVSVINKTAPHPFAARLWIEYLFSDEGQLFFLKGYAHPARYQKLVAENKIPADLAAKLPAAEQYANVKFVTDPTRLSTAADVVTKNWQSQVLGQ